MDITVPGMASNKNNSSVANIFKDSVLDAWQGS